MPALGITVQRRTLYTRSAQCRGGRTNSPGNSAIAVGASIRVPGLSRHGWCALVVQPRRGIIVCVIQ